MIYMVEMALLDTARRAEWDAWYVAHQHHLLSIPGIHASQRFECIHAAASPFVALHEVDGPEVFTSDAYRASAGPSQYGRMAEQDGQLAPQRVPRHRPHAGRCQWMRGLWWLNAAANYRCRVMPTCAGWKPSDWTRVSGAAVLH